MPKSHILLLIIINLVWALNVVALKITVTHVAPLAIASIRYAIVLLICLPFMRRLGGSSWRLILLTGLIAGAAYNGFNALGFALADNVASLAIAGQLGLPFALVFAALFLHERMGAAKLFGVILALAGVAVLTFDARIFNERLGLLLVVLACALWAFGNLLFRKLRTQSVLDIHGWLATVALPCLLICSLLFEPDALPDIGRIEPHVWGWLLFSALGSSILGHVGMSWLLQRYPVNIVLPLTIPSPVLSVIFATIAFDIPVTPRLVAGALLTIAGVALIIMLQSRKPAD